jgi:hypothetical protein
MRPHRYAVGQHVSYAADYSPNKIWFRGMRLFPCFPTATRSLSIRFGPIIRPMTR